MAHAGVKVMRRIVHVHLVADQQIIGSGVLLVELLSTCLLIDEVRHDAPPTPLCADSRRAQEAIALMTR